MRYFRHVLQKAPQLPFGSSFMANMSTITGKQVNLLLAVGYERGINGNKALLEWLEFESGLHLFLDELEDMHVGVLDLVLKRLRERDRVDV